MVNKFCSKKGIVFDIGSQDVNGTYKPIFDGWRYHGVDISAGPNVDIVMTDSIPVPDSYSDLVISGQTLEHCRNPFVLVKEMARILKPEGYLFLIAPFRWTQHKYPIDCWRFLPDGMKCLMQEAKINLISTAISKSSPTEDDCWAVGQK